MMVGIYHSRWRAVAARGTRQFTADRRSGGLMVLPVGHRLTHVILRTRFDVAYSESARREGSKETSFAKAARVEFR